MVKVVGTLCLDIRTGLNPSDRRRSWSSETLVCKRVLSTGSAKSLKAGEVLVRKMGYVPLMYVRHPRTKVWACDRHMDGLGPSG